MNWRNLTSYKCPKCFSQLERRGRVHLCTICDFKIGFDKFNKFVDNMQKAKPRHPELEEQDNQELLNNL